MSNDSRVLSLILATDAAPGSVTAFTVPRGVVLGDGTKGAAQQVVSMLAGDIATGLPPVNILGLRDDNDFVPASANASLVGVVSRTTLFDPVFGRWNRAVGITLAPLIDGVALPAGSVQMVASAGYMNTSSGLVNQRGADLDVSIGRTSEGALLAALPTNQGVSGSAVGAALSITLPAVVGRAQVATSILVGVIATATAQPALEFVLRQGAGGAIIWSCFLSAPIAGGDRSAMSGVSLAGITGASLVLETVGAAAAGVRVYAALGGYTSGPA